MPQPVRYRTARAGGQRGGGAAAGERFAHAGALLRQGVRSGSGRRTGWELSEVKVELSEVAAVRSGEDLDQNGRG